MLQELVTASFGDDLLPSAPHNTQDLARLAVEHMAARPSQLTTPSHALSRPTLLLVMPPPNTTRGGTVVDVNMALTGGVEEEVLVIPLTTDEVKVISIECDRDPLAGVPNLFAVMRPLASFHVFMYPLEINYNKMPK